MFYWLPIDHNLISNWGTSIIRASLEGSAVFILVWVILRVFPKINPMIRCWLWRIAYIKLVVSFLGFEPLQISWLTFHTCSNSISYTITHTITNTVSQWVPTAQNITDPLMNVYRFYQWKGIFILWILGVAWFGFRLIYLWNRNRTTLKDIYPANHQALEDMYSEFCTQLKISKPPRLLLSKSINSPFLQGLFNPKIVLPAAFLSQYPDSEIKLILAHELAHFKRGDLFWNWLLAIVQGIFFFHPVVWMAEREWKELHEICSDHLAVRFTEARCADYGKVLVKATVQPPSCRKVRFVVAGANDFFAAQSKQTLIKRLKALDSFKRIGPIRVFISVLALVLFGLAVTIPWRLFPSVFFSVQYNDLDNAYKMYPIKNLTFNGNIFDTGKIHIKDFKVIIDDQQISEGISINSFGDYSLNDFEGYLLVKESFHLKRVHQIKVFVDTNAGDFHAKYTVDFTDKHSWANHSF